jgi:hypothetical protein
MKSLRVLLLLAPLIFVAHWLEESAGFVAWFNAHVDRGITQELFTTVNYSALGITLAVVALEWLVRNKVSTGLAVAWLSFLMGANALLHVAGAIKDVAYVPGLGTAILLYAPFYGWFLWRVGHKRRLAPHAIAAVAVVGALPMLVHGYLILFQRSRLF